MGYTEIQIPGYEANVNEYFVQAIVENAVIINVNLLTGKSYAFDVDALRFYNDLAHMASSTVGDALTLGLDESKLTALYQRLQALEEDGICNAQDEINAMLDAMVEGETKNAILAFLQSLN